MAERQAHSHRVAARGLSRRRLWLFRLAAIGLGVAAVAAAELGCGVCGWGGPDEHEDPFIGFSRIHPLFTLDASKQQYVIPPWRQRYFVSESFPARKGPNTFRIFCLGGSTVQGRPYSKETSFTTWLKLSLETAEPSRQWDVVNCGGVSYASYRLVPILEECLEYQPDLFVICTGHNEFLEDRTYDHIKHPSRATAVAQWIAARSRLCALMARACRQADDERPHPRLAAEVDVRLDYRGGLDAYHRDEAWKAGVVLHYESNLRRMLALARRRGVPVVLIRPPSNLRDCPSFKSEHRPWLSDGDLRKWEALVRAAEQQARDNNPAAAIPLFLEALRIDDLHAQTMYSLGRCYDAARSLEQARTCYWRARELDVCPLRMIGALEDVLQQVARETETPLIDAHELLEGHCADRILGDEMLVDHIHPSFRGHQLIADALFEELARLGYVHPAANWTQQRDLLWQKHFASLDDEYFQRGEDTLRKLKEWTRGRNHALPIEIDAAGRVWPSREATEEPLDES